MPILPRRLTAITTALVALGLAGPAVAQSCDWVPERAVTYIVPWGAGGGTDAHSRMLASMLEQKFGVPFNVVNRTGGNGVTGHSAIANADPDGYTIGGVTVEITTMSDVGLTDLTYEDVTPIGILDIGPSSVVVKADSQFESLDDLISYAKENPGELTASGTSQGGIWHLALAGMLNAEGIDPNAIRWIPSKGAAPAMQELMAGGVDIATPALSEAKALVEQGELKALAYMHDEPMAAMPDVPTTADTLDSGWTLASFVSVSGPGGLPDDIACAYDEAVQEAVASEEWANFKENLGSAVVQMDRAQTAEHMKATDEALAETIKAVGLAK